MICFTTSRTRFSSSVPFAARPKKLRRLAFCLPGAFHNQDATVFTVSSAIRLWSSGVRILPVTVAVVWTTRRPTSRFNSANMRACSCGGGFPGLVIICSAAAIAFCVSSSRTRPRRRALLQSACCLAHWPWSDFLALGFGAGQFRFDLFGVRNAFGNCCRRSPASSAPAYKQTFGAKNATIRKLMTCAMKCGQSTPNSLRSISDHSASRRKSCA